MNTIPHIHRPKPAAPADLAARIQAAQDRLLAPERAKLEATHAGLQYIIPGAEKRQAPNATQLELLI